MPRSPRTPANGGRPRSGTSNGRPAETGDNITNGNPLLGVGVNGGPLPGGASGPGGPAAGGHGHDDRYKWIALSNTTLGILMAVLNSSIVLIAMPAIFRGIGLNPLAPSNTSYLLWMLMGFMVVTAVLVVSLGRIGDMFGRVRMYEMGFAIFILGSAACALAWNEGSIIGFRILQGIGGAFVTANSGAVIADLFPKERRGRAYGYNSIGWSLGAVLGIVLGGAIVTYVSWRWIFWINVPIGGIALLVATRVLRETGQRSRRSLDLLGMLTLGLGLFGVLWAMTRLATASFDATVTSYLAGGLLLLGAFVLIERRQAEPMLDLSIFRIPTMTPSLLAAFFQGLANFAVLFLVIMYLQGPRGLSPIHASLLLVPGYVGGSVVGPFAGRLADKVGAVIPATVGLGIQVVALLLYAQLSLTSSLWLVVLASVVNGIGASGFFPANSSAVMKASPPQVFGISSGMLRTFSNIGMVFSFALAILIASRSIPKALAFAIFVGTTSLHGVVAAAFTTGLHSAFYAFMVFMVIAAVLSASRGRGVPRKGSAAQGGR